MSVHDTDRVFGPMQLLTVTFDDGADVETRIAAEVDALQGRGVLRLLDLLVLRKNDDGAISRLLLEDTELGDLLSRITPPEPAALFSLVAGAESRTRALAESLPPGGLLVFLLVEHCWARPLFDVIADAGGALVDVGFMTDQAQAHVSAEIAAFEDAAEAIEAAQATEDQAARLSLAAMGDAAGTVAFADAIQMAAATEAANALIVAGLIEDAAADEAVAAIAAAAREIDAARQKAADAAAAAARDIDAAQQKAADAAAAAARDIDAAQQKAADAAAAAAREIDAAQQKTADAAAAASITAGELRVLRYLPTDATFAILAGKLGISRSAAKERAERAYKKLNVHNRLDAVTRARELGLIPK